MKPSKIAFYVIAAIVIILAGGKLVIAGIHKLKGSNDDIQEGSEPAPVPSGALPKCSTVLKRGSRGDMVKMLQNHLNSQPLTVLRPLVVDGVFGPATETMLKSVYGITQTTLESLKLC